MRFGARSVNPPGLVLTQGAFTQLVRPGVACIPWGLRRVEPLGFFRAGGQAAESGANDKERVENAHGLFLAMYVPLTVVLVDLRFP